MPINILNKLSARLNARARFGAVLRVFILLSIMGAATSIQAESQRVWGYVAWWMKDEWASMNLANFERLVFVQIKVDIDGRLTDRHGWPEQWGRLRNATQQQGVPLDLAITVLDTEVFNPVFASPAAVNRLLDESLSLVESSDVAGLHLDIEVNEGISERAIDGFRGFVVALRQRMLARNPGKQLSVFLPFGGHLRIYDAPTLGHVDRFVLQGYDAHYLDSPSAGPVSPLDGQDTVNWTKMLAAADMLKIPRHRMLMGFPLYGYEWQVPSCTPRGAHAGKGEVTTLLPTNPALNLGISNNVRDRVIRYGAKAEPVSDSLYYVFVGDSGSCTVGWFEDWWSLQIKSAWIVRQQLGGIAFFPLGYDGGVLVDTLLPRWKADAPSRKDP